ncbi:MAG: RNA polymerase sigma factor [Bacillota bacterium]
MREDNALMSRFKAGDSESFEKLIVKHREGAVNFARRYLHDSYTAEDIVQESFADIFVYRDRYRDNFSFKTYLFTIIKNKCIDYIRKKHAVPLEEVQTGNCESPEQIVLGNEQRNYIRRMINRLKEDYRTVLYLLEYEDFSYEEIARIMGKNLGQVKILIFRARQKLKTILEKEV